MTPERCRSDQPGLVPEAYRVSVIPPVGVGEPDPGSVAGTPAVIHGPLPPPQSGSPSRAKAVPTGPPPLGGAGLPRQTGTQTLPSELQVFIFSSSALLHPYLPRLFRPLYYSSSFIPAVISSSRRRFRSDPTELHRSSAERRRRGRDHIVSGDPTAGTWVEPDLELMDT